VADASSGPSVASLVTTISINLPAAVDNQPLVQVRWMTANAVGNDEWIGIDDIAVGGDPYVPAPNRFTISKFVVAGGGGTSTGVVFSVRGTIGQSEAGETMASDRYTAAGGYWAFPSVVQVPGSPTLTITQLSANSALISWPSPAPGFELEQTDDLDAANWIATPESVANNGGTNSVLISPIPGNRFYRLSKP